jgi:oxygen-independent coproporphyrinogen-3 oxidase
MPEHLSAYSLIIEEGTPFASLYGTEEGTPAEQNAWPLPDEDSEREMYHMTKTLLADAGYERYEISNYARAGYACRHNLTYWYRGDYLGLGLGAASMIDNVRFSNSRDMNRYMKRLDVVEKEKLTVQAQMEETMFLGLRCTEGVSLKKFAGTFGQPLMSVYGSCIRKYVSQKFLVLDEASDRLYLSDEGMDVSNSIMADFLL